MTSQLENNLAKRQNLGDVLRRSAVRAPDKAAIIYYLLDGSSKQINYQQLNHQVNVLANKLTAMGVTKGDRVAALSRNNIEFIILGIALHKIGAWLTPVNFMLVPKDIEFLINFAEAKLFFVEDEFAATVAGLKAQLPSVENYVHLTQTGQPTPNNWLTFEQLFSDGDDSEPQVEIASDDTATLFFTSGTESAPKGVLSSHSAILASHLSYYINYGITQNDIFLLSLPLIHMAGYNLFMMSLSGTLTTVMTQQPVPSQILQLLAKHKITATALPPTLYVGILADPELNQHDLTHADKFITWSSTIPKAMIEGWKAIAPKLRFFTIQGSSESTATAITGGWIDQWEDVPNQDGRWVGTPMSFGTDVRLIDDDGVDVPVNVPGEQLIRGPVLLTEYYKNDAANKKSFRNGWFHTGDILFRDENNNYFFADRKKDMIKSGGENVFCQEVESVIGTHPSVMQCAVFGMPDDRWGEAVTAAIVLKPSAELNEETIITFCKELMPSFKVPKKIYFRASLPVSAANKILKRELKDEYR